MASETEIAWAAGLFEGEGCFYLRHSHGKAYLALTIWMKDKDVIDRFAVLFGLGPTSRTRQAKPHWSKQWGLDIYGVRALTIAELLEPHLGDRRSAKLAAIRQQIDETQPKERECVCCSARFVPGYYRHLQRHCSSDCAHRAKYLRRKYGTTSEAVAMGRGYRRAAPGVIRGTMPGDDGGWAEGVRTVIV